MGVYMDGATNQGNACKYFQSRTRIVRRLMEVHSKVFTMIVISYLKVNLTFFNCLNVFDAVVN